MPKKQAKSSIQYNPGDLIFAKVKGYPHWPARIDDLPEGAVKPPAKKYPIFFFGTHETAFLSANEVYPYEEYKHKYGFPRNRPYYNDGLWEVENDPTAKFRGSGSKLEEQRLAAMGAQQITEESNEDEISDEEPKTEKHYKKPLEPLGSDESEEEGSDDESSSESASNADEDFTIKKSKKQASKSRKKAKSDSEGSSGSSSAAEAPPTKKRKPAKPVAKKPRAPRKPKEKKPKPAPRKYESSDLSLSSSSESEEDVVTSWKKKDAERRKKHEIEQAKRLEEERKKMREIEKEVEKKQKEGTLEQEVEPKPAKKRKEPKIQKKEKKKPKDVPAPVKKKEKPEKVRKRKESAGETSKTEKHSSFNREQKQPKEAEHNSGDATTVRNEEVDVQQQLEQYEKQLKTALTIENPDIQKALQTLDSIDKLPVTAVLLRKCQSLVATVKKIRRYKASQKVMDKSDKVYHRFKIICTGLENGASLTANVAKSGFNDRDSLSPGKENP